MNASAGSNSLPMVGGERQHEPPEFSIVIPTFNERDNIRPLLLRLEAALAEIRWEAIFVDDDSSDGTADIVQKIAQKDPKIRIIRRIGRRGLSSACVEGVLSSSGPYFAVIDADMQHDETMLPRMLSRLKWDNLDLVVGSRYAKGGSVEGWGEKRRLIGRIAAFAARLVVKADLRDPMSGFFVMRRQAFDETVRSLSQQGFKILLDLFASAPRPLRYAEVPYQFRARQYGTSKLDVMAAWHYGMLLADKLLGHIVPPRFVLFGVVGSIGLLVHLTMLAVGLRAGLVFGTAQTIAVIIAITSNFTLNNLITYRDQRLERWGFVRGLLSFYVICSVGAVANVGVATYLYTGQQVWWLAGLAGAIIGAVWNYAVSAFFTWSR